MFSRHLTTMACPSVGALSILCSLLVTWIETASAHPFAYVANSGQPSFTDNTVSVIDIAQAKEIAKIPMPVSPLPQSPYADLQAIAVNNAGTRVYVSDYRNSWVNVIDATNNTLITSITGTDTDTTSSFSTPKGIALDASGLHAYVADTENGTVSIIDTTNNSVTLTVGVAPYTGNTCASLGVSSQGPSGLVLNLAGNRLYVADSGDSTVCVMDPTTLAILDSITIGTTLSPEPEGIAVNPSGTRVYVTNYAEATVSVIDTTTDTVIANINVGSSPEGVTVNSAGTRVYVACQLNAEIDVIDTSNNTLIDSFAGGANLSGVGITPDGSRLFATDDGADEVAVIATSNDAVLTPIPVGAQPGAAPVAVAMQRDAVFVGGFEKGAK